MNHRRTRPRRREWDRHEICWRMEANRKRYNLRREGNKRAREAIKRGDE